MGFDGNPMAVRWGRLYEGTESEKSLEDAVAALGVPYRTQFPGWKYGLRYFPDFLLPTLKLVIEVDDKSHDHKTVEDVERAESMRREWGVQTVRCTNKEALDNPHGAVRAMLASVGMWPLPQRLPRLAQSLPEPRRAPKRAKREKAAAELKAKRAAQRKPRQIVLPSPNCACCGAFICRNPVTKSERL